MEGMNRRSFLTFSFRAAGAAALFSLVPTTQLFNGTPITPVLAAGETLTYHADRAAWFYMLETEIFGRNYYFGDWIEAQSMFEESRKTAIKAMRRRAAAEIFR
jgi:hypothetical protein